MYARLIGYDNARTQFWQQLERDKGLARLPNNVTLSKENTLSFFKDEVYIAIYHVLRRYRPYDEYVTANDVHMPVNILERTIRSTPAIQGQQKNNWQ